MSNINARGFVSASVVTQDGCAIPAVAGSNTLLYRCSDAFAHAFAGYSSYLPRKMVFASAAGSGMGSSFHFTAGDRTNKTQSEIIGSGLTAESVPISPNPVFEGSDDEYTGNSVTFSAATRLNTASAYVYGVLLEDEDGNVLACKKFDSPVSRGAGYALSIAWTITFDGL